MSTKSRSKNSGTQNLVGSIDFVNWTGNLEMLSIILYWVPAKPKVCHLPNIPDYKTSRPENKAHPLDLVAILHSPPITWVVSKHRISWASLSCQTLITPLRVSWSIATFGFPSTFDQSFTNEPTSGRLNLCARYSDRAFNGISSYQNLNVVVWKLFILNYSLFNCYQAFYLWNGC